MFLIIRILCSINASESLLLHLCFLISAILVDFHLIIYPFFSFSKLFASSNLVLIILPPPVSKSDPLHIIGPLNIYGITILHLQICLVGEVALIKRKLFFSNSYGALSTPILPQEIFDYTC